jgi:hypothetical protein
MLSPREQASFSEDVAFRLQSMLDDIRGRRPDRNRVADPGDAREALDNALANIENDYGADVANDAHMMRQSISEHLNPGEDLSEYVYQLRRNRPGMSEDLRQALDHMAEELESVSNEAPRNVQPATELEQHWRNDVFNGDLNSRQVLTRLNNILSSTNLSVEDLEVLRSIVNDPDSPQFRVADDDSLRQYNDVIDQAIRQREPPQVDNVFGITGRALPTPVPAQPATAPYVPIARLISSMTDQALTADMTDQARIDVQSQFELLTDTNSPEELRNIVSLARSYAMGPWENFSEVQREWLARNIEEYIGDNPPPNTPPLEGHKDGGRIRKYQDGGSTSDYGEPNNAPVDAFDLMKLERWMSKHPEFHTPSKEFNDNTPDEERDEDAQVPRESTFDAKLQTPWEDDEWMMRNYIRKHYMETFAKGGTVQPIPSVEQMKRELMMRRA